MGKRKRVDLPGAVAVAETAAHFDWTWHTADVARFAERIGWSAPVSGYPGNVLSMRLGPEGAYVAQAAFDPDSETLERILVDMGQYGKHADRSALLDTFDDLAAALRLILDRPTEAGPGTLHPRWPLPSVTVGLSFSRGAVLLHLERPLGRMPATPESTFEQLLKDRIDWSPFLAAIPLLTETDPGYWSRADVTRVVGAAGWPVEARELTDHRGARRNQAIVEAESRSDEALISLRAEGTLHLTAVQRFGFGDFDRLILAQPLAATVGDSAYAEALTECVRLLGIPTLVGGPDAWASWRRPDVTFKLSRLLESGHPELTLEMTPTKPVEAQRHWEIEQGRDDEYDDRPWDRTRSWVITPGDLDPELPESVSADHFPEPMARSWARLDDLLYPLFESLAADLPVLQPFANTVVWMISRRKDPDSRIVQGWFGPAGCGVEVLDDEGEWQVTEYEPTAAAGARIAHATHTALRASGVKRPGKLRCEAWSLLAPQELRTFETGLVRGK
ncbi:DUF6301 family protein [Nocardia yamanashiensis]|uniref:DUF6301 family protein n=1 Tax=Nocardia yamanashiensis TaxID=209247 RepID=UPI001E58603E|nr:DUF6301 family protein [Nocardia yamanashiensis]UGT41196.1 DUF6301 family protein [Nocardia yamanashiensis]